MKAGTILLLASACTAWHASSSSTQTTDSCTNATQLATDPNTFIADLAVDDTNLYWLSYVRPYDGTWQIHAVPKTGGAASVLASAQPGVTRMIANGGNVYYLSQSGNNNWQVMSVPGDGSAQPSVVVPTAWPWMMLTASADTLYFFQRDVNNIWIASHSLVDGSEAWLVEYNPVDVAADATSLYYDHDGGLVAFDLATQAERTVAAGRSGGPLAQDDGAIYRVMGWPETGVQLAAKDGTGTSTLVTLTDPQMIVGAIAATGTSVLWEKILDTPGCEDCAGDDYTFQGLFDTPAIGGDARQVLDASCPVRASLASTDFMNQLVVDDANVYWSDGTAMYSAPR